MSWVVVTIITFMLVVLFIWWRRKAGLLPLLDATVSTDGHFYSVVYRDLHPEVAPVEYLWTVLCSAARFIYIIDDRDPSHQGREGAIEHTRALGKAIIEGATDLFEAVGPVDCRLGNVDAQAKSLRVRLYYRDALSRMAMTFLPATWHRLQFHGTLTTLAEAGRRNLTTPRLVALLGVALESLAQSYKNDTFDRASVSSLHRAPVAAFHAAKGDLRVLRAN